MFGERALTIPQQPLPSRGKLTEPIQTQSPRVPRKPRPVRESMSEEKELTNLQPLLWTRKPVKQQIQKQFSSLEIPARDHLSLTLKAKREMKAHCTTIHLRILTWNHKLRTSMLKINQDQPLSAYRGGKQQ
ncbi:Uncharacterized protein Fot_32882 [Forsythia ovata]|uniref:Uncharacterized protein n=1 Tax=Forsythia ovata TaxID=205694 RepID=A0ABD1T925_9LAMI